jgi:hypothetical protein
MSIRNIACTPNTGQILVNGQCVLACATGLCGDVNSPFRCIPCNSLSTPSESSIFFHLPSVATTVPFAIGDTAFNFTSIDKGVVVYTPLITAPTSTTFGTHASCHLQTDSHSRFQSNACYGIGFGQSWRTSLRVFGTCVPSTYSICVVYGPSVDGNLLFYNSSTTPPVTNQIPQN